MSVSGETDEESVNLCQGTSFREGGFGDWQAGCYISSEAVKDSNLFCCQILTASEEGIEFQ